MIFVNLISTKGCCTCLGLKTVGEFYLDRVRGGYQAECKTCTKERRSRWWKSEPGRTASRKSKWKARFGITADDYAAMMEKQNGVCAICEKVCASGKMLSVDHCHETGKVRSLLCSGCNLGIGHLLDQPTLCDKAAAYLRQHGH